IDVKHLTALEGLADGNDHPPARLELLEELRGRIFGGASDDNNVEAVLDLGPAVIAVTHSGRDVVVPERLEDVGNRVAERLDDLDRIGVVHDARQKRTLKAAAGADLKGGHAGFRVQ